MSIGQIPHYFRERSESSPDLTAASTPKRGRSSQDDLTNKRSLYPGSGVFYCVRERRGGENLSSPFFSHETPIQGTLTGRKHVFSEAPLWARVLFDQISKVKEKFSDIKEAALFTRYTLLVRNLLLNENSLV